MSGGHFDYAQYWIEDIAAEIAQRVDWLVSEDDGEDSFMQRLGGKVRGSYSPSNSSKSRSINTSAHSLILRKQSNRSSREKMMIQDLTICAYWALDPTFLYIDPWCSVCYL